MSAGAACGLSQQCAAGASDGGGKDRRRGGNAMPGTSGVRMGMSTVGTSASMKAVAGHSSLTADAVAAAARQATGASIDQQGEQQWNWV